MAEFIPEIRYGSGKQHSKPRLLKAGPITALWENGSLSYIKVGKYEAVRQIYAAVRDRNWGTIVPRLMSCAIKEDEESFSIIFQVENVSSEVDFAWEGTIIGTTNGTITYSFKGTARRDFMRNRIGLCVLHPMELAGVPVEMETVEGRMNGRFPERMSPHQPFLNLTAIRHNFGPDRMIEIKFDGEVFETEDQRMWTDPSYKTYGTPLSLPFPVRIEADETISQTITLSFIPIKDALEEDTPRGEYAEDAKIVGCSIEVTDEKVGTMPFLGLNRMSDTPQMEEQGRQLELMKALHLKHLRLEIDLKAQNWSEVLARASTEVIRVGCSLELEVQVDQAGVALEKLIALIVEGDVPIVRLFVYPAGGLVTTEQVWNQAEKAVKEAGLQIEMGGGSRAYFTQLNRAADEIPWNRMACVQYSLNPQVHTFDNDTLIKSLSVQALTMENTHAIVGGLPVHVGPITLKPRFQATATGSTVNSQEDEPKFNVDQRQGTLFCAGWMVGSLRNLAVAGAASLTYFETIGARGVMPSLAEARYLGNAVVFPVYHIFADVGEFAGAELLRVCSKTPGKFEALALRKNRRLRMLLASFADDDCQIALELPAFVKASIRLLDETTALEAMEEPERFREYAHVHVSGPAQRLEIILRPFAVARVDAEFMEAEG